MTAEWSFRTPDEEAVGRVARELGESRFLARLLVLRGVTDGEAGKLFLDAPLSSIPAPFDMKDLRAGVEIALSHARRGGPVAVFGDYDVDGICSTAIMTRFLSAAGARVTPLLADRFDHGYGLGVEQARRVVETGARCALLLDCGTSDFEGIAHLRGRGIDTVVVDHHRVGERMPDASAFVNPQRPDCPFPYKALTSAGLTFCFAAAAAKGGGRAAAVDPRRFLDLAAVGTIADVAPVTGVNRAIVKGGFRVMGSGGNPALARMAAVRGVAGGRPDEETVSFSIAPQLNAAGRMGSPLLSLRLLLAQEEAEVRRLHAELAAVNDRRKAEERTVFDEALWEAGRADLGARRSLVLARASWHLGVLGIVAAKLVERTGLPVAVAGVEGASARGSIRAPAGMDLFTPLSRAAGLFERFGGHSAAMGFTIAASRLGELGDAMEEACGRAARAPAALAIDDDLAIGGLAWRHVEEIGRLAPFGVENPAPLVCVRGASIADAKVVGDGHLKLFAAGGARRLPVFGPGMGARLGELGDGVLLVGRLRPDAYRGGDSFELLLKDMRKG